MLTLLREAREALVYKAEARPPASVREAFAYVARRLPERFPVASGTCAPAEPHFTEEEVLWVLREARASPRLVAEALVGFYELRAREGGQESMQKWLSRVSREEAIATFSRAAS